MTGRRPEPMEKAGRLATENLLRAIRRADAAFGTTPDGGNSFTRMLRECPPLGSAGKNRRRPVGKPVIRERP